MQPVQELIALFRQRGLKITPQRRIILELLAGDDSHPTAEEIYQRVLPLLPDVSRTTVYNTLGELPALGELAGVETLSEGGMRYDTNTQHHHHLFCMNCHTLRDIVRDLPEIELLPPETSGYQIVKSQVTFYGYCSNCQTR